MLCIANIDHAIMETSNAAVINLCEKTIFDAAVIATKKQSGSIGIFKGAIEEVILISSKGCGSGFFCFFEHSF